MPGGRNNIHTHLKVLYRDLVAKVLFNTLTKKKITIINLLKKVFY